MDVASLCSQIAKRDYFWVQGAGGNVSEKRGNELWIKPSGYRIDEIHSDSDLAIVDLSKIKNTLTTKTLNEADYSQLLVAAQLQSKLRPSMETGFHALMNDKFVAHFHSLVSVLIVHESHKDSDRVNQWYQSNWKHKLGAWKILPLTMPGLELSLQLQNLKSEQVVLLENHGVILQGNGPLHLDAFFEMEKDFCLQFKYNRAAEFLSGTKVPGEEQPIKFLFPDFAIVFDKLFPFLQKTPSGFVPAENISNSLKEIWQAHSFLMDTAGHELEELPKSFVDKLVKLPTEKYRMTKDLK